MDARWVAAMTVGLMVGGVVEAGAQEPAAGAVETLRQQLAAQAELTRQQRALLERQERAIAELSAKIEALTARLGRVDGAAAPAAPPAPAAQPAAQPAAAAGQVGDRRDAVGDMNAELVQAGSFPGSFRVPGAQNVSLGLGGFVKAVAIGDTNAEAMGSDFLPATLGTMRNDTAGNFNIDSTITRLFLDGRAPSRAGALRAYVEYDLNAANNGSLGFKLRHAYGTWDTRAGTLTAGHTWSTAMDLRILPEGLTEPTISGPVFQRQAQFRWSFPSAHGFTTHLAVEDPSGTDIFTNEPIDTRTVVPDFIAGVEFDRGRLHLRANGIVRRLELELESGDTAFSSRATGWGTAATGRVSVGSRDALAFSMLYGTGTGRYVLGLSRGSGGIFDPDRETLRLRSSAAAMAWYRHGWTSAVRSTVGIGYAGSQNFAAQPADAFRSSTYAYGNLMWSVLSYASVGAEYGYGRRTAKGGSFLDNHRIMFGVQVF